MIIIFITLGVTIKVPIFYVPNAHEKNPKTKVLPLSRERIGVIKEWYGVCVFSFDCVNLVVIILHLRE